MVATPMRALDFLLAFVLMRALFLLIELPVLLGFARFVFGVPLRGSLALLVGLSRRSARSSSPAWACWSPRARRTPRPWAA